MKRSFFAAPANGAVAGVIVGVLIVTLMNVFDVGSRSSNTDELPTITTSPAAADVFVDAWTRMKSTTWVIDSSYVRKTDDGRQYSGSVHEAQKPPNHIRVALGTVDAQVNGRQYACGVGPDGATTACRDGGAVLEYNARLTSEIDELKSQVTGADRLYDIGIAKADCYVAYARAAAHSARPLPWGTKARFCFDRDSGAISSSTYERPGSSDSVIATSISRNVPESEFKLPL